jgi:hypothetical protein
MGVCPSLPDPAQVPKRHSEVKQLFLGRPRGFLSWTSSGSKPIAPIIGGSALKCGGDGNGINPDYFRFLALGFLASALPPFDPPAPTPPRLVEWPSSPFLRWTGAMARRCCLSI